MMKVVKRIIIDKKEEKVLDLWILRENYCSRLRLEEDEYLNWV